MVIGMSRRDGRRKYKRRGKRKNQIFLVMMTILACTVTIVLTVKMNNQNVSKGVAVGAEYTAIKSDGNVTEEQLSVSEETVNDLPDVYRIECYESLNQNPELPTGCEITSLTSVLNYYGCNVDKTTMADEYLKKGNGSFYFRKHASWCKLILFDVLFQLSDIDMFQFFLVWFVVVYKDIVYTSQNDEEVCFY